MHLELILPNECCLTFDSQGQLVNNYDRLHEALMSFPVLKSLTMAMYLCFLSFLIPISGLIMSCLVMGMLLSML